VADVQLDTAALALCAVANVGLFHAHIIDVQLLLRSTTIDPDALPVTYQLVIVHQYGMVTNHLLQVVNAVDHQSTDNQNDDTAINCILS
jgi:hypothetical protein